jgi:hypothetical protein
MYGESRGRAADDDPDGRAGRLEHVGTIPVDREPRWVDDAGAIVAVERGAILGIEASIDLGGHLFEQALLGKRVLPPARVIHRVGGELLRHQRMPRLERRAALRHPCAHAERADDQASDHQQQSFR